MNIVNCCLDFSIQATAIAVATANYNGGSIDVTAQLENMSRLIYIA